MYVVGKIVDFVYRVGEDVSGRVVVIVVVVESSVKFYRYVRGGKG